MKTITNQPDRDCRAALAVTNSVIARSEMTRQSMVAMDPRVKPEEDEMPSFRATTRNPQVLRMCTISPNPQGR